MQTPAICLRWRGWRRWFGAHNFLAVMDASGRIVRELHGIARGPAGTQLKVYGGLLPFRREFIWGETFSRQTGFYDSAFPQVELLQCDEAALQRLLVAAEGVQREVNARAVRYPWPALFGANSNAYCATLMAGMGLPNVRFPGELWAPSSHRLLLPQDVLDRATRLRAAAD